MKRTALGLRVPLRRGPRALRAARPAAAGDTLLPADTARAARVALRARVHPARRPGHADRRDRLLPLRSPRQRRRRPARLARIRAAAGRCRRPHAVRGDLNDVRRRHRTARATTGARATSTRSPTRRSTRSSRTRTGSARRSAKPIVAGAAQGRHEACRLNDERPPSRAARRRHAAVERSGSRTRRSTACATRLISAASRSSTPASAPCQPAMYGTEASPVSRPTRAQTM